MSQIFCANRSRECDRVKRSAIPAVSFPVALLRPEGARWPNTAMAATGRGAAAGAPAMPGDEAGPRSPVAGPGSPVAGPGSPVVARSGAPAISVGRPAVRDQTAIVVPSRRAIAMAVRGPRGIATVARGRLGIAMAARGRLGIAMAARVPSVTGMEPLGRRAPSTDRRARAGTSTTRRDPRARPARKRRSATTTRRCPKGSSPSSWRRKCAGS